MALLYHALEKPQLTYHETVAAEVSLKRVSLDEPPEGTYMWRLSAARSGNGRTDFSRR